MCISDADFGCGFQMRISNAERNGENRPLFPAAPHGNFPSEPLCHLPCDGKSQSKAPVLTPAAHPSGFFPSLCYFTQNSESELKRFDFDPRAENKFF